MTPESLEESDLSAPPPAETVGDITEALPYESFAAYMQRCLYDPAFGYYGAGRIMLGRAHHFWTYPQQLRPLFGWMAAEAARPFFDALSTRGDLSPDAPLTFLELGGGGGELARDLLDYILRRAHTRAWKPYADRIRYVIGESSKPLRARQRYRLRHYINSGRAEIRDLDARTFSWDAPFTGFVFANELITSFPCERLRIYGAGRSAHRVHVLPVADSRWAVRNGVPAACLHDLPASLKRRFEGNAEALAPQSFWRLVENDLWEDDLPECRFAELEAPLAMGWISARDKTPEAPPAALVEYLETLEPLIDDLQRAGLLPVELFWPAGLTSFIERLAALLGGGDGAGRAAAMFIDYGGTSRHVLDPRSAGPHLRIYGGLRMHDHLCMPYRGPARHDITCDADFSLIARLCERCGLSVDFFGHQSALESHPVVLSAPAAFQRIISSLWREGLADLSEGKIKAVELVDSFRNAPGFRCLVVSGKGAEFDSGRFGSGDNVFDTRTLRAGVDYARLAALLEQASLPVEAAGCLKPAGDVTADLCDGRMYHYRAPILKLLEENGLLVEAGEPRRK